MYSLVILLKVEDICQYITMMKKGLLFLHMEKKVMVGDYGYTILQEH